MVLKDDFRVCVKFVPRVSTERQTENRQFIANYCHSNDQETTRLFSKIVTEDETRVCSLAIQRQNRSHQKWYTKNQ